MLVGNLTNRNPAGEGSGNARGAWLSHVVGRIENGDDSDFFPSPFTSKGWSVPDTDRKLVAAAAREFSEMVGFWVAWHSTGGFDRLEDHGWSRATIYRKIKRFREHFGAHPDDYQFDWITIDQDKSWDVGLMHVFRHLYGDTEDTT